MCSNQVSTFDTMVSTSGGLTHSDPSILRARHLSSRMGRAHRITTPIHHTTCYPTLSSLFFLPVDLQKGERDTQSCMYPRIWSLGEYIRVQRNDRCRRAKNPKDIERRHSETVGMPEKTEAYHQWRSRRSTCVQESYVRLCLSLQSTVNRYLPKLFWCMFKSCKS
ncbi:hypothetical protein T08_14594 [Trichinella sp. T8]|nr:hypothetical protein T08_14594 [Trichinella sp. T8]